MSKEFYFEKMEKADFIGDVFDICLEAEHDNNLTEAEIEEINEFAEKMYDEIANIAEIEYRAFGI